MRHPGWSDSIPNPKSHSAAAFVVAEFAVVVVVDEVVWVAAAGNLVGVGVAPAAAEFATGSFAEVVGMAADAPPAAIKLHAISRWSQF